jgi:bacillithiol synthase
MEVFELTLPQRNTFVGDYLNNKEQALHYFNYNFQHQHSYEARKEELAHRNFPREQLVEVLTNYNHKFSFGTKTFENINRLKQDNATVVIGGQQAGLLTGPLYSIHKIISIIQLAEQQERELQIPVIPVFWIAGEDHDFQEINHVFTSSHGSLKKQIVPQRTSEKEPVSSVIIDKEKVWKWVKEVVASYGDREHTKSLLQILEAQLEKSLTYTDFFSHLIATLFPNSGIVLIDAADHQLRQLEAPFFQQIIANNKQLQQAVKKKEEALKRQKYAVPIKVGTQDTHLFYLHGNERILLERTEQGYFWGKRNEVMFTEEELAAIAAKNPEKLSNNVVTRPLMQEYLFPCLAFIAGPGEIAYWAMLKEAFSLFSFQVPPVVPRHMLTIVERHIEKTMTEEKIDYKLAIEKGTQSTIDEWLAKESHIDINQLFSEATEEINDVHEKLKNQVASISSSLAQYGDENLKQIKYQLALFEKEIKQTIKRQHEAKIKRFTDVELSFCPHQMPQERVWNIAYYLNRYGFDFCERLLKIPMTFNGKQKIIKL